MRDTVVDMQYNYVVIRLMNVNMWLASVEVQTNYVNIKPRYM